MIDDEGMKRSAANGPGVVPGIRAMGDGRWAMGDGRWGVKFSLHPLGWVTRQEESAHGWREDPSDAGAVVQIAFVHPLGPLAPLLVLLLDGLGTEKGITQGKNDKPRRHGTNEGLQTHEMRQASASRGGEVAKGEPYRRMMAPRDLRAVLHVWDVHCRLSFFKASSARTCWTLEKVKALLASW